MSLIPSPTFGAPPPPPSNRNKEGLQRVLIFDLSPQHLTHSSDGWFESFIRRSKALYAQSIGTSPASLQIEFETILAPSPTTSIDDLINYTRSLRIREQEERFSQSLSSKSNQAEERLAFAIVHKHSSILDAVQIIVAGEDKDVLWRSDWTGPRFVFTWLLNPTPIRAQLKVGGGVLETMTRQELDEDQISIGLRQEEEVVSDEFGIARRAKDEEEVRAHCCTDWAPKSLQKRANGGVELSDEELGEIKVCTCTWHNVETFKVDQLEASHGWMQGD